MRPINKLLQIIAFFMAATYNNNFTRNEYLKVGMNTIIFILFIHYAKKYLEEISATLPHYQNNSLPENSNTQNINLNSMQNAPVEGNPNDVRLDIDEDEDEDEDESHAYRI